MPWQLKPSSTLQVDAGRTYNAGAARNPVGGGWPVFFGPPCSERLHLPGNGGMLV